MTTVIDIQRRVVRLTPPTLDQTFRALGTDVRLIAEGFGAERAVDRARAEILDYHARLSRFLPASELSALNADPRATVPASELLRAAVQAGLWAARVSGGLVDPCLLDALCAAGYDRSYRPAGVVPPPTGPGRPAEPDPGGRWRAVRVDHGAGVVARPPGLRLDLGGSGKGHVADLVARHFTATARWVVSCGGDVRLAGPREVRVTHPLRPEPAACLWLADGAVATSSVADRAWLTADGARAHHLIDPSTGRPAWTGVLSATALAATTLQAETLAKLALLRGPAGAREVLADRGGLIVHAGGECEAIGPLPEVTP